MHHATLRAFARLFVFALTLAALPPRAGAQTTLNLGGYDSSPWSLTSTFDGSGIYYNFSVASGTSTLGGTISGQGGFTKVGSGTLVLVGANSYAGGTTLNAGTLAVVTDTSLGSGSLTINGGTLSTAQHAYSNVSTLDYGSARTLANAVVLNGSFTLGRLLTLSGPVSLGNDITITSANSNTYTTGTSAITGVISGAHSLTFAQGSNPSTAIVLTGTNTYTGGTTITGGLINFNSLSNFGTGPITFDGGGVQWASGNTADISSRLAALGSGGATYDTNGNDVSFNHALYGAGSVTKNGAGTLTLNATSSYTGAIILNAGTLGLGANDAIGYGTLTINGGGIRAAGSARTLTNNVVLNGDFTLGRLTNLAGGITLTKSVTLTSANPDTGGATTSTLSGVISGNYGLTFADGTNPIGAIVLSGANTHTGNTTLQSGTLTLGNSLALQNSTLNYSGGSLGFGSLTSATFGGLAGSQSLALANSSSAAIALTVGGNNANSTYSGTLTGAGSLTKTGSGTLTLSGSSTFSGGTTINAGLVNFSSVANFGSGSVTLNGGGLQWASGSTTDISSRLAALGASGATFDTNGNNVTFASALSGAGSLTKTGSGILTLNGANTYTGATFLSAGTLQIGAGASFGDTAFSVSSGATLDLDDHSVSLSSITGTGAIDLGSATLTTGATHASMTFAGGISGSGGITKAGSGTLTLSGANTYTGATTVSAGTFQIGSGASFGHTAVTVATGALLDLDDHSVSLGSVAGAGGIDLGSATLTTGGSNASTAFSGVISGTGSLTKSGSGTLTLAGANTYSGGTTVSAGTLQIGAGGTTGAIIGNVVTNAALVFNRSDTIAFPGAISGTGSVSQSGAGTLTLSGANTYSGGTVLNAGILGLGSNSAIGTGTLTINGGNLRASGSARTLANNVVLNGDFTLGRSTNLAGNITLARNITLTSANPDNQSASTSTLSGVISGNYGLTFAEGTNPIGAIILSGANTHTGNTTLQGGTLTLGHSLALQNSTFNYSGGTLGLGSLTSATFGGLAGSQSLALANASSAAVALTVGGNNANSSYSGVLSGAGALTKQGSGTLTLSGANTHSGGTTVNAGLVNFASAGNFGSGTLTLNGGGLQWASGSVADISAQLAALGSSGATFHTNGYNVVFASALTGSGALTKAGSGTLTLNAVNTYTGNTTVSGGTLALGGNDRLATTGTVYATEGATFDLAGYAQTLAGLGSASNRFAGNITAGTIATTGALYLQSGTYANTFTGTSATARLWIGGNSSATVTLNGTNDAVYTTDHNQVIIGHATTGAAGTVKLGHANALAAATENVEVWSGTLDLNGQANVRANSITLADDSASRLVNNNTASAASYAGTVYLNNDGSGGPASQVGGSGQLTLSGTLVGTVLNKTGSGTLTLANDTFFTHAAYPVAEYGRQIVVTGGTLALGGSTTQLNFGQEVGFTFNNNSTLRFSTSGDATYTGGYYSAPGDYTLLRFETTGQNITLSNAHLTAYYLEKTGAGTLTLADTGTGSFTHDFTYVTGGTLALTQAGQLGRTGFTIGNDATLDLGGTTQTLADASSYIEIARGALANGTLAFDGEIYVTGGATFNATFTGSGNNARLWLDSYSGETIYLGGSNNRVYTSDHNQVIIGYNGAGTVKLLAPTALAAATENVEIWTGTLDLNGQTGVRANSFVLKSGAASALINGSTTAASFAGGVTLSAAASQLGGAGELTLSGTLSGSGGLTKIGAGSLILTGANTYTGDTILAGGTTVISNSSGSAFGTGNVTLASGATLTGAGNFAGAFQNNGLYAPGNSPALVTLSSFTQGSTGTLALEIAGLTRGTGYDALDIAGAAAFDGTLEVTFIDGFSAASLNAGDSFNFFDWGSVSGTFDTLDLPTLGAGLAWDASALYTTGVLSVATSAIPEPSTYAVLFGFATLGVALWKRRRTTRRL